MSVPEVLTWAMGCLLTPMIEEESHGVDQGSKDPSFALVIHIDFQK